MVTAARLVLFLICALIAQPAQAHSYKHGAISIGHVWARVTGATGAVYLPLLNGGAEPDALTGASTPAAAEASLHEVIKDGDIARMREVQEIPLLPGKPVALRPGGRHIMLFDVRQAYKAGDTFPLTLHFAQAGEAVVEVHVQNGPQEHHAD
ncbi:MAG: copper chaperone PCu(A)C [Alphaproteobacteria bacterium]|nr:copper chaperone PCu(A)C [Alphaproteobacteria bacterium]